MTSGLRARTRSQAISRLVFGNVAAILRAIRSPFPDTSEAYGRVNMTVSMVSTPRAIRPQPGFLVRR